MVRSAWAYGLAGIATLVMATSSTTACCSSLLALFKSSDSCCHQAEANAESEKAECQCCTADNGQPFVPVANAEVTAPVLSLAAVVEMPAPPMSQRAPAALRWWQARPPPLLHRNVVLLI